jgi:hypothetical protein
MARSVATEEHAPTEDEKSEIEAEIARAGFPTSINADKNTPLPDEVAADPANRFVFFDQTGSKILFIQHRQNGEKPDYPWSFWSDGKWRKMEPDGLLPLYGLDKLKNTTMDVMVHEGAKGARDVQAMTEAQGNHPWLTDLKNYVHIGWPGGAYRARQVDWEPIKRLAPRVRVVIVCDRDVRGEDAAKTISSILRRSMMMVMFDDNFPLTFDLADDWPVRKEWWRNEHYCGPRLDDCLFPATWATEMERIFGSDKPVFRVRDDFAAEWVWTAEPNVFINRRQVDRLWSYSVFNTLIKAFSDVDDTARLLTKRPTAKCDLLAYRPGQTSGIIHDGGTRLINTYRPSKIKAVKGNAIPFLRFMTHLFPIKTDRRQVMRWCATLVVRPDIRMLYALLLISETQGVGKTTLGMILAELIGGHNASFPTEKDISDSQFNAWIAHKRLAVVHEIYPGQSRKIYDVLKSIITDPTVRVNKKHIADYEIENFLHVFACSNSTRSLHLDDEDRRWLVPTVTEELQETIYWIKFHSWLQDGGFGIIRSYLEKFLADDPSHLVATGEHSPETTKKEEAIDENRSDGQRIVFDLAVDVKEANEKDPENPDKELKKIVLLITQVWHWVAQKRNISLEDSRLEKPLTLKKAMKAAGLVEPELRIGEKRTRFKVNLSTDNVPDWQKTYIVANFPIKAGTKWADIKEFYKNPEACQAL